MSSSRHRDWAFYCQVVVLAIAVHNCESTDAGKGSPTFIQTIENFRTNVVKLQKDTFWKILDPATINKALGQPTQFDYDCIGHVKDRPELIDQYIYLRNLQREHPQKFYNCLSSYYKQLGRIIYAPGIAKACKHFKKVVNEERGPKNGLILSIKDHKGKIKETLVQYKRDTSKEKVKLVVVTDGERVLDLGDVGANSLAIPEGKLALYTVISGMTPELWLPIALDVGTNNEKLLNEKKGRYVGTEMKRVEGKEYDDFLNEFLTSVYDVYGSTTLIQLVDFSTRTAIPLLQKNQENHPIFLDDIQGTSAILFSGILEATQSSDGRISQNKVLFVGTNRNAYGLSMLMLEAMKGDKKRVIKNIYMMDNKGLITSKYCPFEEYDTRKFFCHEIEEGSHTRTGNKDNILKDVINWIKPTMLIGVSGGSFSFTKDVLKDMDSINKRNKKKCYIMAFSGPSNKMETTGDMVKRYAQRCTFVGGLRFAPVCVDEHSIEAFDEGTPDQTADATPAPPEETTSVKKEQSRTTTETINPKHQSGTEEPQTGNSPKPSEEQDNNSGSEPDKRKDSSTHLGKPSGDHTDDDQKGDDHKDDDHKDDEHKDDPEVNPSPDPDPEPEEPPGPPTEDPEVPPGPQTDDNEDPSGTPTEGHEDPPGPPTEGHEDPPGPPTEDHEDPPGPPTKDHEDPPGPPTEDHEDPPGPPNEDNEPQGHSTDNTSDPPSPDDDDDENENPPHPEDTPQSTGGYTETQSKEEGDGARDDDRHSEENTNEIKKGSTKQTSNNSPAKDSEQDSKASEVPVPCNNDNFFPGISLGIVLAEMKVVPNYVYLVAAQAFKDWCFKRKGSLFPSPGSLEDCTVSVAAEIVKYALNQGLSGMLYPPKYWKLWKHWDYENFVREHQYFPENLPRWFLEKRLRQIEPPDCLKEVEKKEKTLDKYIYLRDQQLTKERAFYKCFIRNVDSIMKVLYTPGVGKAVKNYAKVEENGRKIGLTLDIEKDKNNIEAKLMKWKETQPEVKAIVVTDGEQTLGLGDMGANAMAVPVGKLALYTALGGIDPKLGLAVTLDVGTNNQELLEKKHDTYVGIKKPRVTGDEYMEFVDEFMKGVVKVFGRTTLIQFEDLADKTALRIMDLYKGQAYTVFNDDIQGTAAVTLAGILAANRYRNIRLEDTKILIVGDEVEALAISTLLLEAMQESEGDKEKQIYMKDKTELLSTTHCNGYAENDIRRKFCHTIPEGKNTTDLAEIILWVKPDVLIGVSGEFGVFTPTVLNNMAVVNPDKKPVIMPLSKPVSKSECTAEDAYKYAQGCLFASGSSFQPMYVDEITLDNHDSTDGGRSGESVTSKELVTSQCNNDNVFPGVALGAIVGKLNKLNNQVFITAAETIANECLKKEDLQNGELYPQAQELRKCSVKVAAAVVKYALTREEMSALEPKPNIGNTLEDYEAFVRNEMYYPYRQTKTS